MKLLTLRRFVTFALMSAVDTNTLVLGSVEIAP